MQNDERLQALGLIDTAGRTVAPSTHHFADDGVIPNSTLPALLYQPVPRPRERVRAELEELFDAHGWPVQWCGGVFGYHHYHSTAHEVLGVVAGTAALMLGGPEGETVEIAIGDVLIIPAGVGHRRERASEGFAVVGGYPAEAPDWDLIGADPAAHDDAVGRTRDVRALSDDAGDSGGGSQSLECSGDMGL